MRAPSRAAATLLALTAFVGLPEHAAAQAGDLDWIDWDRLAAGEIVYRTTSVDRGTVKIELAVTIHARWQTVWGLLTACETSPEYVPHVISCTRVTPASEPGAVVSPGAGPQAGFELFQQTVKPAFFLPKFVHVFRLDYHPPNLISVSHVSGAIDRLEGSWRLLDRPAGAITLVHSMTLKPGFPVPRLFVRNTLEHDLPEVLGEVRRRAEAADAAAGP